MTVKDIAMNVINSLPVKATIDDISTPCMFTQNFSMESKKSGKKRDFA